MTVSAAIENERKKKSVNAKPYLTKTQHRDLRRVLVSSPLKAETTYPEDHVKVHARMTEDERRTRY